MNPLERYKLLAELIIGGAILLGLSYGFHRFCLHEQDIGYQKAQIEYQAQLLAATQAAKAKEEALTKQLQEAQNAATQREQTIRSLSAAAGAASNSLRSTLENISRGVPAATVDALRNSTSTLAAVLNECQDRYRGLAEKADRHASDVRTLTDAWPK